ncbi:uncharacterized protein A4U43_C08F26800 [Asparagus officinalis]|nr:uncharacterized protein A4U43_C08F26800 [Asparagus officinalis]
MPLMAFAGPFLPIPAPSSCSKPLFIPSASSNSAENRSNSVEFTYDRAIPSVRWPDLDFTQFNLTLEEFPPPAKPQPKPEPRPEPQPEPETLEPLESKQTRTRAKKMTKLALKRAKDWRSGSSSSPDRILSLLPSAAVAERS